MLTKIFRFTGFLVLVFHFNTQAQDTIYYGGDPSWPPYDFQESGEHEGISKKFLNYFSEEANLSFKYVPTSSWTQTLKLLKTGKIQMIAATARSKEREEYMDFSDPFLKSQYVIFRNTDANHVFELEDLDEVKVAMPRGYQLTEDLKKFRPNWNFVFFEDQRQCLEAVSEGDVEATIGDLTVCVYFIEKEGFKNLTMAAPAAAYSRDIHFGFSKNHPDLLEKVNSLLSTLDQDERADLRQSFFELDLVYGIPEKYVQWLIYLILSLLFTTLLITTWNRSLRNHIQARKEAEDLLIESNEALRTQKSELKAALDKLHETQTQLVQAEKLSSVGFLSAAVNHEVNNLLTYLKTSIYALKRDTVFLLSQLEEQSQESGKIKETRVEMNALLENLEQGADSASEIVASLGEFTRRPDGKLHKVQIHKAIDHILNLLEAMKGTGVEINKEYHSEGLLDGQPGPINQVLLNVLKNAFQAVGQNGKVEIETKDLSGNTIQIEIRDDGPGFKPEELPKIFEAFFTTRPEGEGTGLGLTISRKIIEDHGGKLMATNKDGEGASFVIQLPKESPKSDSLA